jgi:hypothetical protein
VRGGGGVFLCVFPEKQFMAVDSHLRAGGLFYVLLTIFGAEDHRQHDQKLHDDDDGWRTREQQDCLKELEEKFSN